MWATKLYYGDTARETRVENYFKKNIIGIDFRLLSFTNWCILENLIWIINDLLIFKCRLEFFLKNCYKISTFLS